MPAKPGVAAVGLPLELDYVRQENRSIIDRLISALETEPDLAERFYQVMNQVESKGQKTGMVVASK